jgi:hypothetical protein
MGNALKQGCLALGWNTPLDADEHERLWTLTRVWPEIVKGGVPLNVWGKAGRAHNESFLYTNKNRFDSLFLRFPTEAVKFPGVHTNRKPRGGRVRALRSSSICVSLFSRRTSASCLLSKRPTCKTAFNSPAGSSPESRASTMSASAPWAWSRLLRFTRSIRSFWVFSFIRPPFGTTGRRLQRAPGGACAGLTGGHGNPGFPRLVRPAMASGMP